MLNKSSNSVSGQPVPNHNFEPLADPWDTPISAPKPHPTSKVESQQTESQHLIGPSGVVGAPELPASHRPTLKTAQALLQEGLRLKAYNGGHLDGQLKSALGLLIWLKSLLSPSQVLLQDELKLKACKGGQLKAQIQKALALLYWVRNGSSIPAIQA